MFKLDMELILYFKILPTDKRFRSLNTFQKLMLVSQINKDLKTKIDLGMNVADKMFLFMNPELWVKEKERTGKLKSKYIKTNADFKRIQAYGRSTGLMLEDSVAVKALRRMQQRKKEREQTERPIFLHGNIDSLQAQLAARVQQAAVVSDDDEVG